MQDSRSDEGKEENSFHGNVCADLICRLMGDPKCGLERPSFISAFLQATLFETMIVGQQQAQPHRKIRAKVASHAIFTQEEPTEQNILDSSAPVPFSSSTLNRTDDVLVNISHAVYCSHLLCGIDCHSYPQVFPMSLSFSRQIPENSSTVCPANNLISTQLNRKHSDYVTILQLSDLHFTNETVWPRRPDNSILGRLLQDVEVGDEKFGNLRPDIVCVTGDLAENPLRDFIKRGLPIHFGDRDDLKTWEENLKSTFGNAHSFLLAACEYWAVDHSNSLFVIPGNHDLRIQGIYNGLIAKDRTAQATKDFFDIFGKYCCPAILNFSHADRSTSIDLALVCLNSNYGDVFMNFATGMVTQQELDKLGILKSFKPAVNSVHGMPFRVTLVHHHPLPVVPAETVTVCTKPTSVRGRIKEAWRVLMGEQTNLFKNSGSFIKQAMENRVDLILHGHQHHSWYSCINYPHRDGGRLLVAGAPSILMPGHARMGYSIYRLYSSGNIEVIERTTAPNPIEFQNSPGTPFFVMPPSELRETRRQKIIDQLKGGGVPRIDTSYGLAKARLVLHQTTIDEHGNAIRRITFYGLEAMNADCNNLPLTRYVPSGYVSCLRRPLVKILEDSDRYREVEWIEGGPLFTSGSKSCPVTGRTDAYQSTGAVGYLRFDKDLVRGRPVSIEIKYRICNGFEFVREYQRARTRRAGLPVASHEDLSYTSNIIYPEQMNISIVFPKRCMPTKRPVIEVLKPRSQPLNSPPSDNDEGDHDHYDEVEQDHYRPYMFFDDVNGLLALPLVRPMPSYNYQLSWELENEDDYLRKRYSSEGLSRYRDILHIPISEKLKQQVCDGLREIIKTIQDWVEQKLITYQLIDPSTTLRLYLVNEVVTGSGDQRDEIFVELEPCVAVSLNDQPRESDRRFGCGMGIAGQALRRRKEELFIRKASVGSDFYITTDNTLEPHSALFAIPLFSSPTFGTAEPVFGVLCVSSLKANSGLIQLKDAHHAAIPPFLDMVKGRFAKQVYDMLVKEARGDGTP